MTVMAIVLAWGIFVVGGFVLFVILDERKRKQWQDEEQAAHQRWKVRMGR